MATTTITQLLVFTALVTVNVGALPTKPDGPIVHTRYGDVWGMYAEEGAIFLGLTFGVPPVGELRWKPPQAYNKFWAPDIRDGTVPGPACPQIDCRPDYIDYQYTCNRDKNRTQSEDCLLGALGYLVTGEGEDDSMGNYGTLDQMEALKWVQQNIADFGGDNDKVTVIG
ncbi:liver carboxylesterase B-1-like [Branchiostoma floridae x Branchiostoma japonicum]